MMDRLQRYGLYWQSLRPDTIRELHELARSDMRFSDPFNDIHGVERVIAMLEHMLTLAPDVRFIVTDMAMGTAAGYLRWDFVCTIKRLGPVSIKGMSEVHFDADGRVTAHIDHWDAASRMYERLPLFGQLCKLVRRQIAFRN